MSRFGDTAANDGALAALEHTTLPTAVGGPRGGVPRLSSTHAGWVEDWWVGGWVVEGFVGLRQPRGQRRWF